MAGLHEQICGPCKAEGRLGPGAFVAVIGGSVTHVCAKHRHLSRLRPTTEPATEAVKDGKTDAHNSGQTPAADAHQSGHSFGRSELLGGRRQQVNTRNGAAELADRLRNKGWGTEEIRGALIGQQFSPREIAAVLGETMPQRKKDWSAAQADRDAGMSVAEIAKKYGVSEVTIYTRTEGHGRRGRRSSTPKASKAAPAGDSWGIRYIDADLVPGRPVQAEAFYIAVYDALKKCPKGKAIEIQLPPKLAARKNPTGSMRSAVYRLSGRESRKDLRRARYRVKDGMAFVYLDRNST